MSGLERKAVLLSFIKELEEKGSWCGETHIQKSTYFLQTLLKVPTNFNFILYKHGPYSFDMSDEIFAMRADGFLKVIPQEPYGASLHPRPQVALLLERYPEIINQFTPQINFVAEKLSNMGVAELERIATALYVDKEPETEKEQRAERINELKPHISVEEANSTLSLLDEIVQESQEISNSDPTN